MIRTYLFTTGLNSCMLLIFSGLAQAAPGHRSGPKGGHRQPVHHIAHIVHHQKPGKKPAFVKPALKKVTHKPTVHHANIAQSKNQTSHSAHLAKYVGMKTGHDRDGDHDRRDIDRPRHVVAVAANQVGFRRDRDDGPRMNFGARNNWNQRMARRDRDDRVFNRLAWAKRQARHGLRHRSYERNRFQLMAYRYHPTLKRNQYFGRFVDAERRARTYRQQGYFTRILHDRFNKGYHLVATRRGSYQRFTHNYYDYWRAEREARTLRTKGFTVGVRRFI